MTENHETVTVELSGQQQSVTVEQGGQGGSGETGVTAAARDVSMSQIDIPVASEESLGGVKVGRGLAMDGEALGVNFPEDGMKFLRGDGEWDIPPDAEVEIVTVSSDATLPLLAADHKILWTGKKSKGVVMYNSNIRPMLNMATGKLYVNSIAGDGRDLTDLNASQLKSGTIPADRLPLATRYTAGAMSAEDKNLIQNLLERIEALEARLNGN